MMTVVNHGLLMVWYSDVSLRPGGYVSVSIRMRHQGISRILSSDQSSAQIAAGPRDGCFLGDMTECTVAALVTLVKGKAKTVFLSPVSLPRVVSLVCRSAGSSCSSLLYPEVLHHQLPDSSTHTRQLPSVPSLTPGRHF